MSFTDWSTVNNGINVFEAYIAKFAINDLYVERMRQAIPDKYRGWTVKVENGTYVTEYQQWLECTCKDSDWCTEFVVERCVSYDVVQNEWTLLFIQKGLKCRWFYQSLS